MRIGLSVDVFQGRRPSTLLRLARGLGLQHVELTRAVFDDLKASRRAMAGMQAGFHLPILDLDGFDLSCLAKQDEINQMVVNLNEHGTSLNITYCVAHPPEPASINKAMQTSSEALLENLRRLEIPVMLENVPTWSRKAFEELYQKARQLLGERLVGICFDPAHAYLGGEDLMAWFREVFPEVRCLHLSDCSPTEDLHLPFDSGGILPIDAFLRLLQDLNYRGVITMELKPNSLSDLEPVLNSYLRVLKLFHRKKYWQTRMRIGLARLLLRSKLVP